MKNKMKKLEKLEAAARDAYIAYSAAVDSRTKAYRAWDKYTTPSADCEKALAVYNAACRVTDATLDAYEAASKEARVAARAAAWDSYKAKAYDAEVNKMTNTNNIMIPRFITLTPIDEQFEAKFNTIHIVDYASNGKNCVVHILQGSTIKTLIVEETVQDIMNLIGDK